MNPLAFVYTELLFRPLFNLLVGATQVLPTHNVGWAIIFVTIVVRLILLPSSLHQAKLMQKNQSKMSQLQGELKEIKEKHKDDKAKQAEATMELYRRSGVNPASGCLPLLIQLPILIALYRVFLVGLGSDTFHYLYSFMPEPVGIKQVFFGVSLGEPSMALGVIAGMSQFFLMRYFTPSSPQAQTAGNDDSAQMINSMQKNMAYFFPVMTVFIALQLPAALPLYWTASTLLAIVQQYIVKKTLNLSSNPPTV